MPSSVRNLDKQISNSPYVEISNSEDYPKNDSTRRRSIKQSTLDSSVSANAQSKIFGSVSDEIKGLMSDN
jgi:hypothetical protein